MLILGAHFSIGNGFASAAREAHELGCNAMQIFTKNPRGRGVKKLDLDDALAFKKKCQAFGIRYVIAHSSYLLNFAKSLRENAWALEDLKIDFERLYALGGKGVVVHIGKYLDMSSEKATKNVIENAKRVIDETKIPRLNTSWKTQPGRGRSWAIIWMSWGLFGARFEALAREFVRALIRRISGPQGTISAPRRPSAPRCGITMKRWGLIRFPASISTTQKNRAAHAWTGMITSAKAQSHVKG